MLQATLTRGVHMVAVRDDIVVLDVHADRYACLVGAGALIAFPGPGLVASDAGVLEQLKAAGLIDETGRAPTRRAPVAPTGVLGPGTAGGALKRVDTAVRALATTARFRHRDLARLTRPDPRRIRAATPTDHRRIADRAAAYQAVLPFLPFEGLCLQRAYQLRQILASDGLAIDWVFGVRTWPFFAHCWLQCGDRVVGDRIERVRAFTPIAVF